MKVKLYETLLKTFRKANKTARLKMANKYGFNDSDDFRDYLELRISETVDTQSPITEEVKKIHIVDILDRSGSMVGVKLKAALNGINENNQELRDSNDPSVEYIYTLCTFDNIISHPYIGVEMNKVNNISINARGMTSLYDAIGETYSVIKKYTENVDKTLVNIYTDGGENTSTKFYSNDIAGIIKSDPENLVFTFFGTFRDSKSMSKLGIDESNMTMHDNTAASIKKGYSKTKDSRSIFTSSVKRNEDVSKGFYKEII